MLDGGLPIGPIHPVGLGAAIARGLLVQGVGKCACECRGPRSEPG